MGGRLGVWEGVLWVWFCESCVAGVFGWNFTGVGAWVGTWGARWNFSGGV